MVEALEVVEVAVDGGRGRMEVAVANGLVDGAVLGVDLVAPEQGHDGLVQARLDDRVQRRERHHEHAVLGRAGDRAVKAQVQLQPCVDRERLVGHLLEDLGHGAEVARRPAGCSQLRARALQRPSRLQQLGDVDGIEMQHHLHRLAEVPRDRSGVQAVDEGAAPAALHGGDEAHLDERAQRLAHGGPADLEAARLLDLRREAVPRAELTVRDGLHDADANLVHRSHDRCGWPGRPPAV